MLLSGLKRCGGSLRLVALFHHRHDMSGVTPIGNSLMMQTFSRFCKTITEGAKMDFERTIKMTAALLSASVSAVAAAITEQQAASNEPAAAAPPRDRPLQPPTSIASRSFFFFFAFDLFKLKLPC